MKQGTGVDLEMLPAALFSDKLVVEERESTNITKIFNRTKSLPMKYHGIKIGSLYYWY